MPLGVNTRKTLLRWSRLWFLNFDFKVGIILNIEHQRESQILLEFLSYLFLLEIQPNNIYELI